MGSYYGSLALVSRSQTASFIFGWEEEKTVWLVIKSSYLSNPSSLPTSRDFKSLSKYLDSVQ